MLITVSIILLPRLYKSFFQSQHISIGCGSTDSAGFFLHAGILTMCSGGRYLNLGDIHMGGKARKWKWYTCSLFCKLKGNQKKILLRPWQLVHNFYFFHSSNVQTFSSLNLNAVFNFELLLVHDSLQLLTIQLYVSIGKHNTTSPVDTMCYCVKTDRWQPLKLILNIQLNTI